MLIVFEQSILSVKYKCHREFLLQLYHQIPDCGIGFSFGFFLLDRVWKLANQENAGAGFQIFLLDVHRIRCICVAVPISLC